MGIQPQGRWVKVGSTKTVRRVLGSEDMRDESKPDKVETKSTSKPAPKPNSKVDEKVKDKGKGKEKEKR